MQKISIYTYVQYKRIGLSSTIFNVKTVGKTCGGILII